MAKRRIMIASFRRSAFLPGLLRELSHPSNTAKPCFSQGFYARKESSRASSSARRGLASSRRCPKSLSEPRLSPSHHGAGGACEARTDGVQRHLGQGHPEVVAVGRRRGLLLGLQLAQGRCSLGAAVGQEGQEGEQREGLPASGLKGP